MGNGASGPSAADVQAMVDQYMTRQKSLVAQLQTVVDAQRLALESLGDNDDDYNVDNERVAPEDDMTQAMKREFDSVLRSTNKALNKKTEPNHYDEDELNAGDADYHDEERTFAATKPWLGAMAPPTGFKKDPALDGEPPKKLQLEYVFGYRARSVRNNLAMIDENRSVYHIAGVGVVHNKASNTQQFFAGHDDDILCLAYHAGRQLVATGQQGKNATIRVWSVENPGEELACLSGHQRAVTSVAWSSNGEKIASIGLDNDHSFIVHNWKTGAIEAQEKGDTNKMLHVQYNYTQGADPNTEFVVVGEKAVYFCTQSGGSITKKRGLLGNKGERQTFLSVNFTAENTCVAAKSGELYIFKQNKLVKNVQCHGDICFTCSSDGNNVITGGRDGMLHVWSAKTFTKEKSIDMNKYENVRNGKNQIRATYFNASMNKILVGTVTSSIFMVSLEGAGKVEVITQGHYGDLQKAGEYGELWGLACHPTQKKIATTGEDATLRLWNPATRKQELCTQLPEKGICVAFHPTGRAVAIGFEDGSVGVYDATDGSQLCSLKRAKRRVQCISFSPDGALLAAGTGDNKIDLFSYDNGVCVPVASCTGHSSVVNHLDWAKDGSHIQSDSAAYELLFYDKEGKQITRSRDLKDHEYASQSCILGFNVQGIWPKFSDGSDVNTVRLSHSRKLLATCEDSGLVKLFNFPCIGSGLDSKGSLARRPLCARGIGHSCHVTNADWLADDSYLVSTGGADLSIMLWKVVDNEGGQVQDDARQANKDN